MTPDNIRDAFRLLTAEVQVEERRSPDSRRRGQFHAGWGDATSRGRSLSERARRRLTWRNLGFRCGEWFGPQDEDEIDQAFAVLAEGYEDGSLRVGVPQWKPKSPEDRLLKRYWELCGGGRIYVEVPVAGRSGVPDHTGARRRIDGVRFPAANGRGIYILAGRETGFEDDVREAERDGNRDRPAEIIEVKQKLNRSVIGQALAGVDLFKAKHGVEGRPVVVCGEGDGALEWVCQRRNIEVAVFGPGRSDCGQSDGG